MTNLSIMPTPRQVDLKRYEEDRSLDHLCPDKFGIAVLSPALFAIAAIVAVLFAANVISYDVAFAVGVTCAGTGLLMSPLAIACMYSFYAYRNKPIDADQFKQKIINALNTRNIDQEKIQELQDYANEHGINLN